MPTVKTTVAPRQAPRAGAGRPRLQHPFRPMALEILNKTAEVDGEMRPLAAVYPFALDGVKLETLRQRFRRQLTRLGKELRPTDPVTFEMRIEEPKRAGGKYTLIFWDRYAGRRQWR